MDDSYAKALQAYERAHLLMRELNGRGNEKLRMQGDYAKALQACARARLGGASEWRPLSCKSKVSTC
jgi:hypothetical protein